MDAAGAVTGIRIIAIPSDDVAFATIAQRLFHTAAASTPAALEKRLRRTFPRAVVRAREISGDPAWYVYRDGGWTSPLSGPWWNEPGLPCLKVTRDGWIVEATATARGMLEIGDGELATRHFTDFLVAGAMEDAQAVFETVEQVGELTATVFVRPTSGHVLAVDLHARREGTFVVGVMRLAKDVEPPGHPTIANDLPEVECRPATDVAFRDYVHLALRRMPEPTPEGLALRLRRLYPHAQVISGSGPWVALREPDDGHEETDGWWREPGLPTVRYDAQALIVAANRAAEALLGRPLVGHHWQEFVTPGSTEDVAAMLDILASVGRAESRFRMPRADGSFVEFDSYTEVNGEDYTTVIRATG